MKVGMQCVKVRMQCVEVGMQKWDRGREWVAVDRMQWRRRTTAQAHMLGLAAQC